MFKNQIDIQENDYPLYSESLDCLLSLAKENLYYQQKSPLWAELIAYWQMLSENDELEDDLDNGLSAFRQELAKVEEYLRGPETLRLDQDELFDIPSAFRVLDTMVCLEILLENHGKGFLQDISEEFKQEFKLLALETKVYHMPPCHRFIPLNEWRRKVLSTIPENERYRFVWYDLWSSVPTSTIGELIAHWPEIIDRKDRTWIDIPDVMACELIDVITRDHLFHMALQSSAYRFEAASESIMSSVPLGLMSLTNLVDIDIPVPAIVMEKGYQAAACEVMTRPLRSEQERYERLFLAAFLGPDLSDRERLDHFKRIGEWIKSRPKTSFGGLARCLQVWAGDRLTSSVLVNQGFRHWEYLLVQVAERMVNPVEYQASAFNEAVKTLLDLPVVTITTRVNEFIDRLKTNIPSVRLLPDMATVMESLLITAFPAPFALAKADSGETFCQYICITKTNQYLANTLNVQVNMRSLVEGLMTYEGFIDFDKNRPFPNRQGCGLLTLDNELYNAQIFSLNPDDFSFRGEFLVDREITGQLRIILIHESN